MVVAYLWRLGGRQVARPTTRRALAFVATLFENPLAHLSCYSDGQINQGINFIVYRARSQHFEGLVDRRIDLNLRTRCICSLENLSRELFALRCSDSLRIEINPLDRICYMLWDLVVREAEASEMNADFTYRCFRDPEIDQEFLATLARILAIPSVACQRSALHGLGHLERDAKLGRNVIRQYLDDRPNLPEDLRQYANRALAGKIQ
jgi:hypothetical protein